MPTASWTFGVPVTGPGVRARNGGAGIWAGLPGSLRLDSSGG